MGKFRLSVHRKNEVRKKYGCLYRVRIPLHAVSVFTVSIPIDKLSFRISLPRSLYLDAPVSSLQMLQNRILAGRVLPSGKWHSISDECELISEYVYEYNIL